MKHEDFNVDEFDNDGSAAKELLKKGIPISYTDGHGHVIREYPNGRKELVTYDFEKDERVVLKVLEEGKS